MNDQDLQLRAEAEAEAEFEFEQEQEDRGQYITDLPKGVEPDWIDKFGAYERGATKGLASGFSRLLTGPADFVIHQGNRAANTITGNKVDLTGNYPSDWMNSFIDLTMGKGGNKTAHTVGDVIGTTAAAIAAPNLNKPIAAAVPVLSKLAQTSKAADLATKLIGYGTEGGLFSLFSNPKTDTPVEDFVEGGALNTLVSGGLKTVGSGIRAVTNKFPELASAIDRKSLGARVGDYGKASGTRMIETPEGEIETFVKSKLDDLLESGELGKSRDPGDLAKTIEGNTRSINNDIESKIASYDEAVAQGTAPAAKPEFDGSLNYLAKGEVPAHDVDSYLNELDELNTGITKEGGSLKYLQEQKKAYSSKWKAAAKNEDPKAGFYRALYDDLKTSIEKHVPEVKGLNSELQKYMVVDPIVDRAVRARDASSPLDVSLRRLISSKLVSPQNQARAASALRGAYNVTSPVAPLFTNAADPLGKIAALQLFSDKTTPTSPTYSDLFTRPPMAKEIKAPEVPSAKRTYANTAKDLMKGLIKQESSGRSDAISKAGAKGLTQLMDATGKEQFAKLQKRGMFEGEKYDPFDEDQNRIIGESYLEEQLNNFDGNIPLALTAYNQGPSRVKNLLAKYDASSLDEILPYLGPDGRSYARSVLAKNKIEEA